MKVKIYRMAALVLVLLMAACQPTPDSEIVVNKNQGGFIDKASSPSKGTGTLAEKTGAPSEFKFEPKTVGKLKLKANAKVVVPSLNQIPIVRVKAADFSQEQATAYFDYLCKGIVMEKGKTKMTKSEIEEQILWFQKSIADAKSEDKEYKESFQKELKRMQEQYKVAPESIPAVLADGILETEELKNPYTDEVYARRQMIMATEKMKKGEYGKSFYLSNNSDQKETMIFEQDEDGNIESSVPKYTGANLNFYSPEDVFYDIDSAVLVAENYVPDVRVSKDFKLTAAEAKAQIQALLDTTKTPLMVYEIRLIKSEQYESLECYNPSISGGNVEILNAEKAVTEKAPSLSQPPTATPKVTTKYAYQFNCRRIVENIPCAEIIGAAYSSEGEQSEDGSPNYEMMQESWTYEQYFAKVTDEGIVSVNWVSPLDITAKPVEDCALKPFSEIQSTFEKMMSVKYEFTTKDDYLEEAKYNIDRVELELMRILEQDSMETGLLIPVWRFYGTQELKYKLQEGQEGDPYVYKNTGCFLTLNAVDGALIDEQKGY